MEDKEIEKKLKKNADKIQVKDFSSRWDNIKGKINIEEIPAKETVKEQVLIVSGINKTRDINFKRKSILIICVIFCIISLCIILPLVLRTNNEKEYFYINSLKHKIVDEVEFRQGIKNSGLELINVDGYNIDTYSLLVTENNIVKGGSIMAFDEDVGYYLYILFYGSDVISDKQAGSEYTEFGVEKFKIFYKTEQEEDGYATAAIAKSDTISYEIDYVHLEDDAMDMFNKLFA